MTAKEAYERATEKLNETSEKEINNVLKLIEIESEKGKYVIRSYDIVCEATINHLKKLGYDVTYYFALMVVIIEYHGNTKKKVG